MWHNSVRLFLHSTHIKMVANPKKARRWNILVLLIVGLAAAVFAWGLRYKLSEYQSATHTVHRAVLAKLLSDRERPADTSVQIERATIPTLIVFCALFTLFAGSLPESGLQPLWLLQRTRDPQRRPDSRAMRRLFSRPPPVNH